MALQARARHAARPLGLQLLGSGAGWKTNPGPSGAFLPSLGRKN